MENNKRKRLNLACKSLLAAVAAIALNAAFSQQPVVVAESLQPGVVVSGAIQYGRRTITLPVGNWRVVRFSERNSNTSQTGATMLDAHFDEIVDGRLNRVLALTASKFSGSLNWTDEPCKTQGDAFWINDQKRGINDQFCTRVGFLTGIVDGARGEVFQNWARNIVATGTKYSPDMPFVQVTRYTSYDFLAMHMAFNPEVYGIPRSQRAERQFNDWHPKGLAQQPERLKFYEALKVWGPTYAAAVSRNFEGDKTLSSKDFQEPVFNTATK